MGTQPIGKLLFGMSIPLVISMLVQALYNVVDSYFVSNMELIGNKALNAISLAYPIQMLMVAFSVGTGVGMNAYISRCLGMGDHEKADRGAANGMLLLFVTSLVFTALGFFTEPFFKLFTDDPEILELGTSYLRICMIFCLGIFIQIGGERILQGMGKNNLSMIAQLVGAVTNIVLDPMLIYGIGFFPELGMRGAAAATVIGQWLGMVIALLLVVCGKHEVTLKLKNFRPDKRTVAEIYRVGAPSIIMQSIGSVMTVGLNAIFSRILASETGVSITGVYFKIQSIIFMPVFGMTNAAMSIMAFNYGAANRRRLMRALKLTIIAAVLIMLAGVLIFELAPELLPYSIKTARSQSPAHMLSGLSACISQSPQSASVFRPSSRASAGASTAWLCPSSVSSACCCLPRSSLLSSSAVSMRSGGALLWRSSLPSATAASSVKSFGKMSFRSSPRVRNSIYLPT